MKRTCEIMGMKRERKSSTGTAIASLFLTVLVFMLYVSTVSGHFTCTFYGYVHDRNGVLAGANMPVNLTGPSYTDSDYTDANSLYMITIGFSQCNQGDSITITSRNLSNDYWGTVSFTVGAVASMLNNITQNLSGVPSITISSPGNNTYNVNNLSLNYSATDPNDNLDKCWYSLDDGSNTTLSGCENATLSSLADGSHNVTVYVNDSANNLNLSTVHFSVDTPPPQITISSPENKSYNTAAIYLNWSTDGTVDWAGYSLNANSNISLITVEWFYQESANVTSCSGNWATGTYSCAKTYDGDWGTLGYSTSGNAFVYFNYTKPGDAISANWTIKAGFGSCSKNKNYTIRDSCFAQSPLQFRVLSKVSVPNYSTEWRCWNGTGWANVYSCETGIEGGKYVYEEAVWWQRKYGTNVTISASEGSNNITVYANDSYGDMNSSTVYFSVDTNGPDIRIVSPANTTYATTSIELNWSADEDINWSVYSLNGTDNVSLMRYAGYERNYQENADSQNCEGQWSSSKPCNRTYDGDWSIGGNAVNGFGTHAYVYFNYSKPANAVGAVWETKGGWGIYNHYNATVSEACFALEPIQFKVGSMSWAPNNHGRRWWCWNGTEYTLLVPNNDGGGDENSEIFEEAVWWNISVNISTVNTTLTAAEGLNNVTIWANDSVGNMNSSTVYFTVDTVAPTVSESSPINDYNSSSRTISFQFTVTDNLNETTSCILYIDNVASGANSSVKNATLTTIQNTSVPTGSNTWYVNCTDGLQMGNSTPRTVNVDTSFPTVTITYPSNTTYYNVTHFNFSVSEVQDECWYNTGSGNITIPNCQNGTSLSLSTGQKTLEVYANDSANNIGGSSVVFTLDQTKPKVKITSPINTTYASETVDLNYTASDANIDSCWYSLDGGSNTTLSGCGNATLSSLAEGPHNVTVYVNDSVSNLNSSTVYFTVDTSRPVMKIDTPANGIYWNYDDMPFYVNGTCSDDNMDKIYTNSTIWSAYDSTSPFNISNSSSVSEGTYTVRVHCNDTAGNTSYADVTFTYDNTNPALSVTFPSDGSVLSQSWINITGTGIDNNTDTIYINDTNFGSNLGSYTNWNFTNTSISEGTYDLLITANDSAGNVNSTRVSFTIDRTPPVITSISFVPYLINPNAGPNTKVLALVEMSDALSSVSQVKIVFYNATQFNSSYNYTHNLSMVKKENYWLNSSDTGIGLPTQTEGNLYYNVTAVDAAGNVNNTSGGYVAFNSTHGAENTYLNTSLSSGVDNRTTINTTSKTNATLEIKTNQSVTNASVGMALYSQNPRSGNVGVTALGKYLQIEASPDITDTLSWILIKVYYSDDELSDAGIDESTLRIYYWNETLGDWEVCDNTGVNTTANYVWANLTHFSLYGIYASPPTCSDGTHYGTCSATKPLYCDNDNLVDNCQSCGCPSGQSCRTDGTCFTPRRGGVGGVVTGALVPVCAEDWTCSVWTACSSAGLQTRVCTDLNECGTEETRPAENRSCEYVPEAPPCTEDWTCSVWSTCSPTGTQKRTCVDRNNCGTIADKPPERQSCRYVEPRPPAPPAPTIPLAVSLSILAIVAAVVMTVVYIIRKRRSKKPGGALKGL